MYLTKCPKHHQSFPDVQGKLATIKVDHQPGTLRKNLTISLTQFHRKGKSRFTSSKKIMAPSGSSLPAVNMEARSRSLSP